MGGERHLVDRRRVLGAGIALTAAATPAAPLLAAARKAEAAWTSLFNGRNLDGWYTFLAKSGRDADPSGLVRVRNGMIHVMGVDPTDEAPEAGYFATVADHADYHFRVEFKWGQRRFPPRRLWKRDNGILYHLTGEDRVWPVCMEFQAQEGDIGDAYGVPGARGGGAVRFTPGIIDGPTRRLGPPGLPAWPDPLRPGNDPAYVPPVDTMIRKQGDFEYRDAWNVLDLICVGDKAAHLVNGRIVSSVFNIQVRDAADPTRFLRLDRGRIALEVEYAEIFFRNVQIRPVGPADV